MPTDTQHSAAKPFELECSPSFGGVLHGIAQTPREPGPRPTVVICHGFKGFMDWGFFPSLAELLRERGFTVIRFNYSGSGMRPGDELVSDTDAFRDNTFSLELDETLHVLDAATELVPGRVDPEHMSLLGHSRGGGTALLASASDAWRERLRALVTWASVSTFDRFGDVADRWRRDGALDVSNARTGQELQLGAVLLDDIDNNRDRIDLYAAAVRRTAPWLIVHGEDDETVSIAEGESLAEHAAGVSSFERVASGSHTFNVKHPFVGPSRELIQALNATQRWLRRYGC